MNIQQQKKSEETQRREKKTHQRQARWPWMPCKNMRALLICARTTKRKIYELIIEIWDLFVYPHGEELEKHYAMQFYWMMNNTMHVAFGPQSME